ncbi:sensor histidine kinase [Peredibacter starrii]|uniref:histidine kinase n=1 Tax=Peredibacter starrii TaxID=28202 RepID=A0AAX4HUD8_9BACT|nr:ATP-binding protein [Peredibacter starrii]WPU66902.1 PAS domain S-box protein [Peredibacter starrii]
MLNAQQHSSNPQSDYRKLVASLPGMYIVMLPDAPHFTIVDCNSDLFRITKRRPEEVIGKPLFEAFPDNPDHPEANGVKNLLRSLLVVMETKSPHTMAIQRYDVKNEKGIFEERYWNPINYPVLDDAGNILYVINQGEDVTELIRTKQVNEKLERMETEVYIRAREIQEVNEKLRSAEAKYRGLFESAQDAIVVLDKWGKIKFVNHQTIHQFGYTEEELVNRDVELLVPERLKKSHLAFRLTYFDNPIPKHIGERQVELCGLHKDGHEFPISVTLSPLLTREGLWITAIIRDISETKRLMAESIHAREDIIATVSHDLKNPLSSIVGNVALLTKFNNKQTDPDPKLEKIIHGLQKAAGQMTSLIQNLLDFSKLEAKCFVVNKNPQNVSDIVQGVTQIFEPLAWDKKIKLTVSVEPNLPILNCDNLCVNRVLSNLLSNAIKFTPKGGSIEVQVKKDIESIVFMVKDNGPGISEEEIEHVFDRYWQSKRTAIKGTGLGLAIVKGIIDAHDGYVWVECKVGVGSAFYFTLPLNASATTELESFH